MFPVKASTFRSDSCIQECNFLSNWWFFLDFLKSISKFLDRSRYHNFIELLTILSFKQRWCLGQGAILGWLKSNHDFWKKLFRLVMGLDLIWFWLEVSIGCPFIEAVVFRIFEVSVKKNVQSVSFPRFVTWGSQSLSYHYRALTFVHSRTY